MADTANRLDFSAHMNLISKQVKVYGVPNFEEITYDDWYRQCEQEFKDSVLKGVSYAGVNIIEETPERITFKSIETVEGNDGNVNENYIEFIIQRENDGAWRVVQERILPMYELASDQQSGVLQ